jgi:peptide-methionine (S)-S-oxide reductase
MQTALFGAGCFWGIELAFSQTPGVVATKVGYSGGDLQNPRYDDVCSGTTGHTEVVQVSFDPDKISYHDLVEKFFTLHDPTQLNRQGPDIGHQYRSVVLTLDAEQEQIAREVRTQLSASNRYKHPVVTAIEPAPVFWPAEEYHQQYLAKQGRGACQI